MAEDLLAAAAGERLPRQAPLASCHGEGANGGQTAPTLHSKQFLTSSTDDQMAFLITGGVPGSSMSAWDIDDGGPMTQQQISDIVGYLGSLEQGAPSVPDWRKGVKAG